MSGTKDPRQPLYDPNTGDIKTKLVATTVAANTRWYRFASGSPAKPNSWVTSPVGFKQHYSTTAHEAAGPYFPLADGMDITEV